MKSKMGIRYEEERDIVDEDTDSSESNPSGKKFAKNHFSVLETISEG